MAGLMMMEPDPEKQHCQNKNAKYRGTIIKMQVDTSWLVS
jgi:hypothetical protein